VDDLRDRSLALLERGDLDAAIALFEQRLAAAPDDADALVDLGLALSSRGDAGAAEKRLAAAVDLDPDHLPARRALAAALRAQGKLDAAVFQLLRAAARSPADAATLRELGAAFYDKGLYDKALAAFERARAVAPSDPLLLYAMGLALEAKKEHGAAIAAYRESVRLDPASVASRHTLADALASFGEHELAIAELEALLRFDRTNEAAAGNLEVLRAALGQMRTDRLLGRPVAQLRASALIQEAGFRDQGRVGDLVVLGTPYAEVYAAVSADDAILSLFLTLLDPRHAAKASGKKLGVQVVDADGTPRTADLATALGITFLREGLGISGTQAAQLWQRAASDPSPFAYAGVTIAWTTLPRPNRSGNDVHGLDLRLL